MLPRMMKTIRRVFFSQTVHFVSSIALSVNPIWAQRERERNSTCTSNGKNSTYENKNKGVSLLQRNHEGIFSECPRSAYQKSIKKDYV